MPVDASLPLSELARPHDAMRFDMDDEKLAELIDSIRCDGVLEPLLVIELTDELREKFTAAEDGEKWAAESIGAKYEVRAGDRRLISCRALNLSVVPCRVFTPDEPGYAGLMATENLIRQDASAYEEGVLFIRIRDTPGITEELMRRRCGGKSLGYIYERIALVEGDREIALAVHRGLIAMGVAKKLNQIRYPAPGQQGEKLTGEALQNAIASADAYRASFLERAIIGGCTIQVVEMWLRDWRQNAGVIVTSPAPAAEPMPPGGYPLPAITCAVCGESDEPHKFETVSIHRQELAAIRMAMAKQLAGG